MTTSDKPIHEMRLSELLRAAVADSQHCEANPARYTLDMGTWYVRLPEGHCAVCMAGAVMARRLLVELTPQEGCEVYPGDFGRRRPGVEDEVGRQTANALLAVNSMRHGAFVDALCRIGGAGAVEAAEADGADEALALASRAVSADYDDELHRAPWHSYLAAAQILEDAGL